MPGTNHKPFIAADNFLDYIVVNRDHSVSLGIGSVASGSLRALWDGRRGDRSTVTLSRAGGGGNDARIKIDTGGSKSPGLLWIDAGHNMDGEGVVIEHSDDDVSISALVSKTIGTDGVSMDDGSWAYDLSGDSPPSKRYWYIQFKDTSADPVLSNMFLGPAFYLGNYVSTVARDDSMRVDYPGEQRSERGVRGFGQEPVQERFIRAEYRTTKDEWDTGSNTIEALRDILISDRMPILWCTDWADNPERMRLYMNVASQFDPTWRVPGYRDMSFDLVEVL